MSASHPAPGLLRRLWLWCLYVVILGGVLALALMLSLPFLATPENVTKALSHYVGGEVSLGEVRLEVYRGVLQGEAADLELGRDGKSQPDITIRRMSFKCYPWLSILKSRADCDRITASGVSVDISGLMAQQGESAGAADLLDDVLGIASLQLEELSVQLRPDGASGALQVPRMVIASRHGHARGTARVDLPGSPEALDGGTLQLDFATELKLLRAPQLHWSLRGDSIDLAKLMELLPEELQVTPPGLQVSGKLHKPRLSGTLSLDRMERMAVTTGAALRLERGNQSLALDARRLALNVDFDKGLAGTRINGMSLNGRVWDMPESFYASFGASGKKLWWPRQQRLDLALPHQLWSWWQGQEPANFAGEVLLENAILADNGKGMEISSLVHAKSFTGETVAAREVSGIGRYANGRLEIDITAGELVRLSLPNIRSDIEMNRPSGTVHLWQERGQPGEAGNIVVDVVDSDSVVQGARAGFRGMFSLRDGRPYGDFAIALRSETSASVLMDYLPSDMDDKLVASLREIIAAGRARKFNLLYRGIFSDYPYASNDGMFQAEIELADTTVQIPETEPGRIDGVHGDMLFRNELMRVNISQGKWDRTKIDHATLLIPDMLADNSTMQISGDLSGTVTDIIQSGNRIMGAQQGEIELPFHVTGSSVATILAEITGLDLKPELHMREAAIAIAGGAVTGEDWDGLQDVNGTLEVRGGTVTSDEIRASWLGQEAKLSLLHRLVKPEKELADTEMTMHTRISSGLLRNSPMLATLAEHVSGSSELRLQLWQHGTDNKIAASSSLQGLAITLPAPLSKAAEQKSELRLLLDRDETKLEWNGLQVEHSAGGQKPGAAIKVRGKLGDLKLEQWVPILQGFVGGHNRSGQLPGLAIDGELEFSSLQLSRQRYQDIGIRLSNEQGHPWELDFGGEKVAGKIVIPKLWLDQQWLVDIEHLHLEHDQSEGRQPPPPINDIDPNYMPTVALRIKSLLRGETDIGKLEVTTERTVAGQRITDISADGNVVIKGAGEWLRGKNDKGHTSLELSVNSRKMYFVDKLFDIGVDMNDAATDISATVSWPGTPVDFSMQRVLGEMQLEIDKGSLENVHNQAGRWLSMLSLGTIIDRLQLDFSELASAKFKFNGIGGTLIIKDSILSTDDLTIDGSSLLVNLQGHVNLHDDSMEHEVTVVPKLSGNMAALLGLAGAGLPGLGIGTAIMLLSKLTPGQSDLLGNIVRTKYRVSGTIEDTKIERIEEPQQQQESEQAAAP